MYEWLYNKSNSIKPYLSISIKQYNFDAYMFHKI